MSGALAIDSWQAVSATSLSTEHVHNMFAGSEPRLPTQPMSYAPVSNSDLRPSDMAPMLPPKTNASYDYPSGYNGNGNGFPDYTVVS